MDKLEFARHDEVFKLLQEEIQKYLDWYSSITIGTNVIKETSDTYNRCLDILSSLDNLLSTRTPQSNSKFNVNDLVIYKGHDISYNSQYAEVTRITTAIEGGVNLGLRFADGFYIECRSDLVHSTGRLVTHKKRSSYTDLNFKHSQCTLPTSLMERSQAFLQEFHSAKAGDDFSSMFISWYDDCVKLLRSGEEQALDFKIISRVVSLERIIPRKLED